ncbi:hypothetical protein [Paenibacillus sp. J2TS4]|uniref:hypothetical protein n=1 Tax=Paenibacillus sp. J2TS4 TaxID=2807194 RepID=UPI001B2C7817|nr:hypothetical protein [Paenibacillus sp. J2TS4]GIP34054.1 hypothetical protein J2TS4_32640 [Paenibacillus sp. J2TS4]
MVSVLYNIPCFDSEVMVKEIDEGAYELAIQSTANPLGLGNALETYPSREQAVRAAEHFCKLYTLAREQGYYLKERSFVKPDREPICLAGNLNSDGLDKLSAWLSTNKNAAK